MTKQSFGQHRVVRSLARALPEGLQRRVRRTWRAWLGRRRIDDEPWNTVSWSDDARDGPLARDVFARIRSIPGWFNVDDCAHFHLVLSMQTTMGVTGDLFEIGSYHGRSTAAMASRLAPGERLVVCDAFEADTSDRYANPPSPEALLRNVCDVNPGLDPSHIEIHACLSTELEIPAERRFRFAHVDGGHSHELALGDLVLVAPHVLPHGVIAVDDHDHPGWPGVTTAVAAFQEAHPEFHVLADLNRHGARGRKLYLVRHPGDAVH